MKVGVFRNSDGACDLYRASLPIETATKLGLIQSSEIWMANLLYESGMRTQKFWDAMGSDIYLIQRLSGQTLMNRIREFISETKLNTKIVIDHDDDVFNVSPLSNHYVDYGTEEIKVVHNKSIIHEWKDGVNIDLKENIKRIDEIKRSLEKADMVTVTTDKLLDVFKHYNDNIKILPNCVDISKWNKLHILRKNPDEIRICWAGGHSHWEDLFMIKDPLIQIAKEYPNVKIVMVGYMPTGMEKNFRPGQIEFYSWVDTLAHPYRMATLDIDIAVIPLKDTPFNRCKSAIKWIEFSSLEIPCVSSYLSPYKEIADLNQSDNGIYVESNDKSGWVAGLDLLINSSDMRKTIGEKARQVVQDNFDINTQYHQWISAYGEVLNGNTVKSSSK